MMTHTMNTRPPGARGGRAFSLLEVLVAVVVIALLALLAFSGTRRVVTSARIVQSSANLRSLVVANAAYAADHGVYCPVDNMAGTRRWCGGRTSYSSPWDRRKGYLSPYLGESEEVNVCPLFRAAVTGSSSFEDGSGGYGYNDVYIGGLPGGAYDRTTKIRLSQRPTNVPNPARTVMFTTSAYAKPDGLQEYGFSHPPFWDDGEGPNGMRPSPSVHFRAHGKAIVAWCDGHISTEIPNGSTGGYNPHGGDAEPLNLGWFGPEENNGYWNPAN